MDFLDQLLFYQLNFIFRAIDESIANRRKLKKKNRFYDLPRTESEKYINDWMPAIGIIWKGNMDAQFVSEKSITLTRYITGYGTKGEKTNIEFESIQSNKSLHSRLWSLPLKALNHRECGAVEAADALLGYPLYKFDPLTKVRWLKGGEDSYEKAFINQQHQLAKAMQYLDKQQSIKDGMIAVEKLIEKRLNESIEEQDSQENDDDDDFVPIGIANDINDLRACANKAIEEKCDIEDYISKFNEDQSRIFKKITDQIISVMWSWWNL